VYGVGVTTEESYDRLKDLISVESGFRLDEPTPLSVESCIRQRMDTVNLVTYGDYLEYIDCHADGQEELKRLIAAITVNETNFYRHPDQFRAFKDHVVPEIIDRKLRRGIPVEPIMSVWSAGCSTGDETYTIALQVREALDPFHANNVEILGTDIDEQVLPLARSGLYNLRTLQYVDERRLRTCFEPDDGGYRVKNDIRRMVNFRYHNLVRTPYPRAKWGKWDVIFCRNVIIYFDSRTVRRVVTNIYDSLAEGGYLFLGYSESLNGIFKNFTLCRFGEVFAYRKDSKPRNEDSPGAQNGRPTVESAGESGTVRMVERTRELLNAEKYDDALKAAEILASRHRDDPEACAVAARVFLEKGKHDEAAESAGRAIDLDPLHTHAHFILGVVCRKQKEFELAIRYLRRALYLDDTLAMAHFQLAGVYQKTGRSEDAVRRSIVDTGDDRFCRVAEHRFTRSAGFAAAGR
jgi:chemotaxis protein methyltransferase CheR